MINSVIQHNPTFRGKFEIEELPLKKYRRIIMDIHPGYLEEMGKILPRIKARVENELPDNDKVKFKLFKSAFFGDTRYKINYIPAQESNSQGLEPKSEDNWPRNIAHGLEFIDNIINQVNKYGLKDNPKKADKFDILA